jgi:hypothetical protein
MKPPTYLLWLNSHYFDFRSPFCQASLPSSGHNVSYLTLLPLACFTWKNLPCHRPSGQCYSIHSQNLCPPQTLPVVRTGMARWQGAWLWCAQAGVHMHGCVDGWVRQDRDMCRARWGRTLQFLRKPILIDSWSGIPSNNLDYLLDAGMYVVHTYAL